MTDETVFEIARRAIASARQHHPAWPRDVVHASAIVAEEAGELVQAALEAHYEGGKIERTFEEAIHVIVTAVRFLSEGQPAPKILSFPADVVLPPPPQGKP